MRDMKTGEKNRQAFETHAQQGIQLQLGTGSQCKLIFCLPCFLLVSEEQRLT